MTKVLLLVVTGLALVLASTSCTVCQTFEISSYGVDSITSTSAVVHWYTEDKSYYHWEVEYGLTKEYGTVVKESSSPEWVFHRDNYNSPSKWVWDHQAELKDLQPGTTYYYRFTGTYIENSFTTNTTP